MNGKPKDMSIDFAIKILSSIKVANSAIHGNPIRYGYQNQTYYDIARNMAIQALKRQRESNASTTQQRELSDEFLELKWSELTDVPFDKSATPSGLVLAEDWWRFKKGTDREEIWRFFDMHSKGAAFLLYGKNK